MLGHKFGCKTDSTFWDKAEAFPGGFIIQRELEKALSEKPFFYRNDTITKPIHLARVIQDDFWYYYNVWDDFHTLKILPHGQGTLHERGWVLETIKLFEKSFNQVENFEATPKK